MKLPFFPIVSIIVVFLLMLRFFIKKSTSGFDEAVEEFKKKEIESNNVFKKMAELDLKYMYPNKNALPFKNYDENDKVLRQLIKKQALVLRKLDFEMVRLPLGLNNTELKEKYGINNFNKVSLLEEHYNGFIRAIFEWAKSLYDIGEKSDCKTILYEAIRLQGDISQIYILMSEIYFEEKDKAKLLDLKNTVESYELSLKDKILNDIEEKISLL